jgi:predicted nucleic acid-binding protein
MIILDSSFLIGFHNSRDAHHEAARAAMPDLISGRWGEILLPEYVFLEVATVLLARRKGASFVASFDTDFIDIDGLSLVPEP